MSGLKDKVVVITGGSSGIGAGIALEFAKHKARLVITGRNKDRLKDVAKQCLDIGANEVNIVTADLTEDEGIETVVKATMDIFGTIHVLVNNAGEAFSSDYGGMKVAKGNTEGLDSCYRLLLRSPWKLTGLFMDELVKNKGCVINNSSVFSRVANPNIPGYCMMKAAISHMTKLLAVEYGMQGVRVNCVEPGATVSQLGRNLGIITHNQSVQVIQEVANKAHVLEQKVCLPEDQAKMVVFLASDDARMMTGVCVPVDGGFLAAHPTYNFDNTNL